MNWLGKCIYSCIRRFVRFLPGGDKKRVRIALFNDAGEILMVRSWLSSQQWSLPGGGIEQNETPETAAVRELQEETGLSIEASHLRYLTTIPNERLKVDLMIFIGDIATNALPPLKFRYKLEIIERAWMPITDLPTSMSQHTNDAIAFALETKN